MSENRLLAKLPVEELEALRPDLEQVTLAHSEPLIIPDEPIPYVYFPAGALASMVTVMEDGSTVESGAVGCEGMVGIPVLLDAETTPMQTVTQIPGGAVRVRSTVIKRAFDAGGVLQKVMSRYMHGMMVTGSQTAACNRLHRLEQRLCRWLMMSSDGIASDCVPLTQEFLAVMLGVRRAGVSEAAAALQREGLIRYTRGVIEIVDRGALEAASCECYRKVKAEFDRLLG